MERSQDSQSLDKPGNSGKYSTELLRFPESLSFFVSRAKGPLAEEGCFFSFIFFFPLRLETRRRPLRRRLADLSALGSRGAPPAPSRPPGPARRVRARGSIVSSGRSSVPGRFPDITRPQGGPSRALTIAWLPCCRSGPHYNRQLPLKPTPNGRHSGLTPPLGPRFPGPFRGSHTLTPLLPLVGAEHWHLSSRAFRRAILTPSTFPLRRGRKRRRPILPTSPHPRPTRAGPRLRQPGGDCETTRWRAGVGDTLPPGSPNFGKISGTLVLPHDSFLRLAASAGYPSFSALTAKSSPFPQPL